MCISPQASSLSAVCLQHSNRNVTATHCNTLQHIATHCNAHCNTHCNTCYNTQAMCGDENLQL